MAANTKPDPSASSGHEPAKPAQPHPTPTAEHHPGEDHPAKSEKPEKDPYAATPTDAKQRPSVGEDDGSFDKKSA